MYYVLIAGNGETSRANIEALMDDFYYSKGKQEGTVVIAYEKSPTRPQMFAAQFAKEKERDIVVFAYEDAQTIGIPGATFNPTGFPVRDAIEFISGQDAVIFSMHLDGDIESNLLLKGSAEKQLPIFNLRDGLLPLNDVAAEPVPEQVTEKATPAPEPVQPKAAAKEPSSTRTDILEKALQVGLAEALKYLQENEVIA
jgi:hypothetical protein